MFVLKRFLALLLVFLFPVLPALGETVTASFFPVYLMARNLTDGIEGLEVHSLTAPDTGCLHDYQLSTGDLKALEDSKLFLICGAGMEAFLPMVQRAYPDLPLADASAGLTLLPSESGETEFNAHIWLDPDMASVMAENLCRGLRDVFPEHAEALDANLAAYKERLTAMDEKVKEVLAPYAGREIITFHEAFPYFAQHYGLSVAAVIALEPEEALSPRELGEMVKLIEEKGSIPLFTEPQYPSLAAEVISSETGAPLYTLDPCVTAPEGEVPLDWYEQIMQKNADVLVKAFAEP